MMRACHTWAVINFRVLLFLFLTGHESYYDSVEPAVQVLPSACT